LVGGVGLFVTGVIWRNVATLRRARAARNFEPPAPEQPPKPQPPKTRRTLDDMRALSEEIKKNRQKQ
jgi:hypothetical protein